jgi:hypothetical protein
MALFRPRLGRFLDRGDDLTERRLRSATWGLDVDLGVERFAGHVSRGLSLRSPT